MVRWCLFFEKMRFFPIVRNQESVGGDANTGTSRTPAMADYKQGYYKRDDEYFRGMGYSLRYVILKEVQISLCL